MTDRFPRSMGELAVWATSNSVTIDEARRRFAQYIALCGIASVRPLREGLVFKGGNALDFVWQPNRSTTDLDFSLDITDPHFEANTDTIRALLGRGFNLVSARFGMAFAIHGVRQNPPGMNRTFITYETSVGYALPDERQLLIRMANNQTSSHVIRIEISINDPICDSTVFTIDENYPQLRVSTLEDIVGEKLRALLQQKETIRKRKRRQDLLDIAVILRTRPDLNREQITAYLQVKAAARFVPVSRAAFHDPEIAECAQEDYAALEATTRVTFIPFDDALATVLAFVDDLPIPAE
ncbi:MAG: nucleotidyl transferase AbiEii/AbiGii toxin family protein [Thermomicrobiales bacterium]